MIDYLKEGRTINGAYYAGELIRLHVRQEITRKRQGKLTTVFCSCKTMPLSTRHKLP